MPSMLAEILNSMLASQRSRPLSIAVVAAAMILPTFLVMFESDPALLPAIGLNAVVLLSLAISLPIVLLCFGFWYTLLKTAWIIQRRIDGNPATTPRDVVQAISVEDPFEWPCLLAGGWTANLALYLLAAVGHFRSLRLGASFLLLGAILLALWVVCFIGCGLLLRAVDRRLARNPVPPAAGGVSGSTR
jgi:hypothetical protein